MTVAASTKVVRGLSVKLTDAQHRYLRRMSCTAGATMSEYVRLLLEQDERERRQLASFVADVRRKP
jgi:hypothetical protein